MNIFVETKSKINLINKRLSIHNALLIIFPITLFITLFIIGGNSYKYRGLVMQFEIWVLVYFFIILIIANRLKIYKAKESLLFILWMIIINGLIWLVTFSLMGKYAVFLFPFLFLFVGPIFNILLGKTLRIQEFETFKDSIIKQPKLVEESFNSQKKDSNTVNIVSINSSIIGNEIIQSHCSGIYKFTISNLLKSENNILVFTELHDQLNITRISNDYIQTMSLSSGNRTIHLDNKQILTQLCILSKN